MTPRRKSVSRRLLHQGRTEQYRAALKRCLDAEALLKQDRWLGAMYMRGYGTECLLKARMMETFNVWTLAELEVELGKAARRSIRVSSHEIEFLFSISSLLHKIDRPDVKGAYSTCSQWSTTWRYRSDDGTKEGCEEFFRCAKLLDEFILGNL